MTFPTSREHSFPSEKGKALFESEAVLHLSTTRLFLLVFGCVLPEASGAVILFKIYPWISVLLFAAALSTVAFIATFLRRQACFVRVYPNTIEVETRRSRTAVKRTEILEFSLGPNQSVVLKQRDEVQVIDLPDPKAFQEAYRRMTP